MECIYCNRCLAEGATSCSECGTPMSGAAAASTNTPAERRLLTILFCDLVGSTALAVRLDPEDLHELLAAYQRRATDIIEAAGGMVARYAGDGILAYFGFPAANEDDAERAVMAGLELTSRINDGNPLAEKFAVRVGIATGIVVVGDLLNSAGADRPFVVGETPNLAARLQELAEPGAVVIASDTQRLVGGLFEYRPLQLHQVKGFAEPITAWQVLGKSELACRFEALRSKRPIVGREAERARLLNLWEKAARGHGQAVIISGEAGIGKSRLALDFIRCVRREFPIVRRYDCSPHHSSSMLHPLLEQLRQTAQVDPADPVETKFDKLEAHLASVGNRSGEVTALIGDLMALPVSDRFKPPQLDARRKLEFLFQSLLRSMETVARQRPMIIFVEDVHWMDPTSRALLDLLIPSVRDLSVFVVVTIRSGSGVDWPTDSHVAAIRLGTLDSRSAEVIVRGIADRDQLSDADVQSIVERAGGIPLFLEELTRAALETDDSEGALSCAPHQPVDKSAAVPAALQGSLMSRLDRLGQARQVATVAAALGREFKLDLLRALLPDRSEENLDACLERLVNAELICSTGLRPEATYAFRHALLQDVAYGTLLRSDRRSLHGQIARVLQQRFPEIVAMQPEIVARHFANAGMAESAIDFWLRAGERAASRSAFVEAVQHFSEGIALADAMPESPGRVQRQIDLHLALGPAIMATKGYAASESRKVFLRAEKFVSGAGNVTERMEVLLGLFNVRYGRAEIAEAMATAGEHMALAQAHGVRLARAHTLLGQTHASMGAFVEARRHLERAVELFAQEPENVAELGVFSSHHVVALAYLSGVYSALGEVELAQQAMAQSLEQANTSGHPMSMALAKVTDLLLPLPGGLNPDVQRASEVVRFCKQHGLNNFEMWASFALGATMARCGDLRGGFEMIRAAIDAADAMSSRLLRPIQIACLAGTHAKLGEIGEALSLIVKAIGVAEQTGERQVLAALYRAHGELLCAIGRVGEGKQRLSKALDVARAQQAKSEEQRIEKSIAALMHRRAG